MVFLKREQTILSSSKENGILKTGTGNTVLEMQK
jgi:hypothetical protein